MRRLLHRFSPSLLVLALSAASLAPAHAQSTGFTWGIVVGAETSISAANRDLQTVQRKLGQNARLFRCNSWIRTVIVVTDRRMALQLLAAAQKQIRPSSYLVDMRIWCPTRTAL